MRPSTSQIQLSAYFRWERRGYAHGFDRADWLAAEHDLLFSLNYEILRMVRLDGQARPETDDEDENPCRFCELQPPRVSFDKVVHALPRVLGGWPIFANDVCDDCRDHFHESIDEPTDTLMIQLKQGNPPRKIPIAALKGLTRLALGLVPREELDYFSDALEWVINPDHDLDRDALCPLPPHIEASPEPFQAPWAALARRVDDDETMPYLLFFIGVGHHVITLPVPFCQRDEDLEGNDPIVPEAGVSLGLDRLTIMAARKTARMMSPFRDLFSISV